jgi:cell division protein FtsW (lipid II flippase)
MVCLNENLVFVLLLAKTDYILLVLLESLGVVGLGLFHLALVLALLFSVRMKRVLGSMISQIPSSSVCSCFLIFFLS